jgi:hypothetical protein
MNIARKENTMSAHGTGIVGPQIVIALYKPHSGKDADLRKLIAQHIPTLRRLELITDRPSILMKSKDGTYLEIFEWANEDSAGKAHTHPEVAKIWEAMGPVSDLPVLGTLEEVQNRFPHFVPVSL